MTETVVTIDPNRNPQSGQPKPPNTTATASQGGGLGWIQCNVGYFKTLPGILKLVQLFFGIICMACASPAYLPATDFFLAVVVLAFIASLLWTFAYLLGIREVLALPINWILTELLNTAIATGFYAIAFIVQLSKWSGVFTFHWAYSSNVAAGVFGLFNTLAYGAGVYFLWIEHKNGSTQ